jgi:hypothetical protein
VRSQVEDGWVLLRKPLHAGDADLYVSFRTARTGRRELRVAAKGLTGRSFMGASYLLQDQSMSRIGRFEDRPESLLARSLALHSPLQGSAGALLEGGMYTDPRKIGALRNIHA